MSVEHIWKQKQVVFGKNSIEQALKKREVLHSGMDVYQTPGVLTELVK